MGSDKHRLLTQKFSIAFTQWAAPACVQVQTMTTFEVGYTQKQNTFKSR